MDIRRVFQTRVDYTSIRSHMVAISWSRQNRGLDIKIRSVGEFLPECLQINKIIVRQRTSRLRQERKQLHRKACPRTISAS
jgi:hypothetical protein